MSRAYLRSSKDLALKNMKTTDEVLLLSSLIAVFGVALIAAIALISVYMFKNQSEEIEMAKMAATEKTKIQMKNIQTAGKALIVSKLNKLQKGTSEEKISLTKDPMSNRPSDLTQTTNDDFDTTQMNSEGVKKLGDPFTVKTFKI